MVWCMWCVVLTRLKGLIMGREVLGTMVCPECGQPHAQVKAQKNGKPYRYCPECDAQYFARSDLAAAALLAKVGKTAPAPAAAPAAPAPEPAAKAKPAAKPAAKTAPAPAPAAEPNAPAPAAPVVKRSGLSDALGFLGVKS